MRRGQRHTPEVIAKIRATLKGRKFSSEHRVKISVAHRGRKFSSERCAKMSIAHMGRKSHLGIPHSEETRARLSVALKGRYTGSDNGNWLGGIGNFPYAFSFNEVLKEEVRVRDGHRCQLCGVLQIECLERLPVHHIDYDKKNSDPANLLTLCKRCNARVNGNRRYWKALFQVKMIQRGLHEFERHHSG